MTLSEKKDDDDSQDKVSEEVRKLKAIAKKLRMMKDLFFDLYNWL